MLTPRRQGNASSWIECTQTQYAFGGGWGRDTIIHYLHTTSNEFTDGLTIQIFQYGNYALTPRTHGVFSVPSGTLEPYHSLVKAVSRGLEQDWCGLNDIIVTFYTTLSIS